jgi:hypothetical protein
LVILGNILRLLHCEYGQSFYTIVPYEFSVASMCLSFTQLYFKPLIHILMWKLPLLYKSERTFFLVYHLKSILTLTGYILGILRPVFL